LIFNFSKINITWYYAIQSTIKIKFYFLFDESAKNIILNAALICRRYNPWANQLVIGRGLSIFDGRFDFKPDRFYRLQKRDDLQPLRAEKIIESPL